MSGVSRLTVLLACLAGSASITITGLFLWETLTPLRQSAVWANGISLAFILAALPGMIRRAIKEVK